MISKGAKCSISGKQYELKVYNIVKKCKINNNYFNIQNEDELGVVANQITIQNVYWIQ